MCAIYENSHKTCRWMWWGGSWGHQISVQWLKNNLISLLATQALMLLLLSMSYYIAIALINFIPHQSTLTFNLISCESNFLTKLFRLLQKLHKFFSLWFYQIFVKGNSESCAKSSFRNNNHHKRVYIIWQWQLCVCMKM